MATANDIIKEAKKWEGTKESPANSNNVIFNTEYYGRKVSGSAYPWCAAFIWAIFKYAGASSLFMGGGKSASCTAIMNWYKKRKQWTSNVYSGKTGDLAIFKWNTNSPQHIGIVIKNLGNGKYQTIEGNTAVGNDSNGGEVMVRTRYASQILGFCNVKYDNAAAAKTAPITSKYSYDEFVKDVQRAIGATVDGVAGTETLNKTITVSKTKNNRHGVVLPIQKYLNSLGYNCGEADGVAGTLFDNAIKAYQRDKHLTADGEITARQNTWKYLLGDGTMMIQPIKKTTSYKVKINTPNLRVRSGAGTSYSQVGLVTAGQIYEVTEEKNGWGKINKGWISLQFTKRI